MKAYQLIDSPEKWCQSWIAEDRNGERVNHRSPRACRWCLLGAVARVYGKRYTDVIQQVDRFLDPAGRACAVAWNDAPDRQWEDVYGVLRALDL